MRVPVLSVLTLEGIVRVVGGLWRTSPSEIPLGPPGPKPDKSRTVPTHQAVDLMVSPLSGDLHSPFHSGSRAAALG